MNAVQGLKVLAAVMGVLIIGAVGLLGYGVYSKLGGSGKGETEAEAGEAGIPAAPLVAEGAAKLQPPAAPGVTRPPLGLEQPDGSRIADASTDGPLLTLRIEGGELPDRVAVVDLRTGGVVGWVHVGGASNPAAAR